MPTSKCKHTVNHFVKTLTFHLVHFSMSVRIFSSNGDLTKSYRPLSMAVESCYYVYTAGMKP